jgi:DNA repair exonuclease SbcCD nuclease subunit
MTEDQLRTFHRNGDFMQALINNGVDFLIVGGMAVKFYRCRDVVDDLNVMLNPTDANVQRFFHALHVSKLNVPSSTKTVSKLNVQIPLKLDLNLDVFTPPDGIDYESLKQRSSATRINNIPVHVVSRKDLIELKRIALTREENEIAKHQREIAKAPEGFAVFIGRMTVSADPKSLSCFSCRLAHHLIGREASSLKN